VLLGLLVVVIVAIWWPRGRVYPRVPSEEGQHIIKMLYTACNTRDTGRLERTQQRLEKAVSDGTLEGSHADAFRRVIAKARSGDWAGAEADAFRFAEDQVR
jgi:hypothetical protein